jgi:hypothetical protein
MQSEVLLAQPHPNQLKILKNKRRFNHVKCGRRFGKTELVKILSSYALYGKRIGIWFPTYKDLSEVWVELLNTFFFAIVKKDEQLKQIRLVNNGLIDFWSMDDPDSGRGRKYDRAIIDEAAKAKRFRDSWRGTIRPTLTDYKGDAWFFSTPKGKNNYFFTIQQDMKDHPEWAFFKFTSYDNPYLDPEEINGAKNQLDDITFRQEYLAEDVDANDSPFLYSFEENRHVISDYKPNINLPIIISFDFNKEPMTCIVGQSLGVRNITLFDEMKINNGSTPELCEMITAKYKDWLGRIVITGDASGHSRSSLVRGGLNHYIIIKKALMIKDYQMKVRKSNLSHINSRMLCNSVIQNAEFAITENCRETILDCIYASVDEHGQLIKTTEQGRHFFDNVRYMIDAQFYDFISTPNKYKSA